MCNSLLSTCKLYYPFLFAFSEFTGNRSRSGMRRSGSCVFSILLTRRPARCCKKFGLTWFTWSRSSEAYRSSHLHYKSVLTFYERSNVKITNDGDTCLIVSLRERSKFSSRGIVNLSNHRSSTGDFVVFLFSTFSIWHR